MFFRRGGNSSIEDSGAVDLAKVKAQEAAKRKREEREQRAAERQKIWGDRSRYSVRDHLSFWAEILIEKERERRAEKDYRRNTFRAMLEEQRAQLDEEMRPKPKLEQQQERGQVVEHSVLDELRQQRERDQGRGRSMSDEI
jgi:hypothetical protein